MALPSFNVLSLCSGYGGLDLAIKLAIPRARTICYAERESTVARILAARFRDGSLDDAPIWSDVKTFRGRTWRGAVDCLCAGYPCQPFSVAGKQRGAKDPRHLWPDIARIIGEVQPAFVFLENVDAHLRIGFRAVAQKLRSMGYQGEAGVFSAEEVGAPHLRKRLFVLAYREGRGFRELWESSGLDRLADGRGEELEDAARLERGPARQHGGRRGVRETGNELADAGDGFLPLTWWRSQGRTGSGSAGAQLENSGRAHHGRRANEAGLARSGTSDGTRRAGGALAEAQRAVADPPEQGLSQRHYRRDREEELAAAIGVCLPAFPPGPDDLEAWKQLLQADPSLEPALCGASDGPGARVDELRALGNGVVPIVASYAFCTLARALGAD